MFFRLSCNAQSGTCGADTAAGTALAGGIPKKQAVFGGSIRGEIENWLKKKHGDLVLYL
jgi:hypothetical protein